MYNYIIIGSVIVICVCSLILIMRKLKSKKTDLSAVPISDIEEIQILKKSYSPTGESGDPLIPDPIRESLEAEVNKENSVNSTESVSEGRIEDNPQFIELQKKNKKAENELATLKEIFSKESEYFIGKIESLEQEKVELKDSLFKEVNFREEAHASEMDEDKDSAEETSQGIHSANQRLLQRIQNQKESIRQMKDQIKKVKSQSYEIQNEDRYKIEDLEYKLSDVIYEKEKMEKQYEDIEKLTTYNLKLRMKTVSYARAHQSQKALLDSYAHNSKTKELQMKSIVSELKMENTNLIAKVKESVASVANLRDQIKEIKLAMQERMKQMLQGMTTVSNSAEETQLLSKENEQLKRLMKNAEIKIEALTEERQQLLSDISRNEFNYDKLKQFNASILEKEKMLQYELTKSRAKSLGLEKICEDFKVQIEKSDKRPSRVSRVNAS